MHTYGVDTTHSPPLRTQISMKGPKSRETPSDYATLCHIYIIMSIMNIYDITQMFFMIILITY